MGHIAYFRNLLQAFERFEAVFSAPRQLIKYWEQGKF